MAGIVSTLLGFLVFAIFARFIMDLLIVFGVMRYDSPIRPVRDALTRITEPILAPIRRFACFGTLDLSPMVAIFILTFIQSRVV